MTDEQINKLKTLLESSSQQQVTPQLDEKILQQAKSQSELNLAKYQSTDTTQDSGWSFANSAIAFSALAFTVAILFSLAEMTSVNETDYALESTFEINDAPTELANKQAQQHALKPGLAKPSERPAQIINPSLFEQEVLAEIDLPSTSQLLDSMHFTIAQDRQRAEQEISLALRDINQSLNSGNLATARQRYQQLREGCTPCSLPQTLEALAKVNSAYTGSG